MKNNQLINRLRQIAILLAMTLTFMACTDDENPTIDPEEIFTGQTKTYDLDAVGNSGISGTALLEETSTGNSKLTITLTGTPNGGQHPAHIHFNSAAQGGGIAVSLTPINGTTGISETTFSQEDDGTNIKFSDLLTYNGYINVHLSATELGTIVAQGDIGSNELTGTSKTYTLNDVAVPTISGEITFEERVNGFALATISLTGTPDGGMHPAHIHSNSAAVGGGIEFTFNPVNGTTGMSKTDTRAGIMDGENGFTYAEILEADGYVNVHVSADDLGTIVAQGDIGSNELTGESQTYPLNSVAIAGISGEIIFQERINGFALATITLMGTPDGGSHPAHIHANSAQEGGGILYTFNPVNGTTG
ncbi:CHRD domain-containing protein, partial [Aquiflexum sp.]|uniref:CHRD domain-containing protein n=1 Tax=Aquiflexum sp. TaxID=1872584 RepID=UPI003593CA78